MANADLLYKVVGNRIRAAREGRAKKVSQANLAKQLGISRASIVNIEAGRQHAPLGLLSEIAHALDTELVLLIPHRSELTDNPAQAVLDKSMLHQIKLKAAGDGVLENDLTIFVGQMMAAAGKKNHRRGVTDD